MRWVIPIGIFVGLFWLLVPAIIETIAENKEINNEDNKND